jgi:ABC-2 type transport system ATP-binding protein
VSAAGTRWGVRDLTVRYGDLTAVSGVTLDAARSQVTALVGGDGAGKTSVLRALVGAVQVAGGQVSRPDAHRLGYVSAGPGIWLDLSVREHLGLAAAAYGLRGPTVRGRTEELLARTGLTGAADRLGGQLSGGMRRKLALAAAMLHEPDLLVLDEVTTGIDPVSRAELWRLIAEAAAGGAAVVLATSYLDEAERAGAVVVLHRGRELAAGTPAGVVAAMPGALVETDRRPQELAAWRHGRRWRAWSPDGTTPEGATPATPRLEDAVIVATLAQDGPATARSSATQVRVPSAPHAPERDVGLHSGPTTAGEEGPVLQVAGVTRRFGSFTAVDRASLSAAAGEVVGLLGANGAGKTTLVRMILGLLAPSGRGGQVRLFGRPPGREARRRVGYVPQGLGLYEDLTVRENLDFHAAAFGLASPPALDPELAEVADRLVGELPLGLARRAAFAAALGHSPELLVLDEPTSGVEPLGRAGLWDTIRAAADAGAGVLVTTHFMDEAEQCDRLVVMVGGQVRAEGTVDELVGGAQMVEIVAERWEQAFAVLVDGGPVPPSLSGRALRLPATEAERARRALAEAGVEAELRTVPATLEEAFVRLTVDDATASGHAA